MQEPLPAAIGVQTDSGCKSRLQPHCTARLVAWWEDVLLHTAHVVASRVVVANVEGAATAGRVAAAQLSGALPHL